VIGVIGVLVGLLLPAVQRTREAASRIKCANNLRQIGLAMQLHLVQFDLLPPSRTVGEGPSWAWLILPELEQDNLYRLWDVGHLPIYKANQGALKVAVPVFFCPSRRPPTNGGGKPFTQRAGCYLSGGILGATGDYAASIGTTGIDYPQVFPSGEVVPPNGAFVYATGLSFSDFRDGASNTILVGEKHVPAGKFGEYPLDCSIYDGHNPSCNVRPGGPDYPIVGDRDANAFGFGSYHPTICQFVFADGGVHAIKNSISPLALGLLVHRADGQAIPEGSY
jgi:hypothetical protein